MELDILGSNRYICCSAMGHEALMLRITRGTTTDGTKTTLLRLEGQVTGRWVEELRRSCQEALGTNGQRVPLALDLADVLFIDADGIALFRELAAQQVKLANGSLFITEQLKGVTHGSR